MVGFDQKRSLAGVLPNVRFPVRKRTFEAIAAAHNDLFVGHVGLAIPKRKKSANSDFAA